ncbi:MAG: sulfotransferase family protein [Bacteroidia bacterium]
MTNENPIEKIKEINNIPIVFVIVKERSGTTLLQVMLNAHSNIVAPPESCFIMLLYLKYGSKTKWNEKDIKAFCNDLFTENLFRNYWNIDKEKFHSFLLEVKEYLTYPLVCKLVFYSFAPTGKEIKMFVDKNPPYYDFIPKLYEIFPGTRFIHIVRDYRANIVSHKRISIGDINTANKAYRWLKVNSQIEDFKSKMPEQWFTLKYETLVTETEEVMRSLCGFIGIAFEKEMIETHNTKLFPSFYHNQESNKFKKIHKNLFQPINKTFIDEWKEKMTNEELAIAESLDGQFAEKTYGYKFYSGNKNFHINPVRLIILKWRYIIIRRYFHMVLKYRWAFFIRKYVLIVLMKIYKGK